MNAIVSTPPDLSRRQASRPAPARPTDRSSIGAAEAFNPACGRLEGETLVFDAPDGLARAFAEGCFLLRAPEGLDVSAGLRIAAEFPETLPEPRDGYRGYRELGDFCFRRAGHQVEQLIVERQDSVRLFPPELQTLFDRMNALSATVLRFTLRAVGIPENQWDEVTDGAAFGRGTHWFVANHYDRAQGPRGCGRHKDTGFVTVLFTDQPGLQGWADGTWRPIASDAKHFVVNFGIGLEVLTRRLSTPVNALMHQVTPLNETGPATRVSFGAFAGAPTGGVLYEYADGVALPKHDVDTLLVAHDATTWQIAEAPPSDTRTGLQAETPETLRKNGMLHAPN